jgi:glycosyltransferase involved in cell wall biosynthesis
MHGLSSPLVSCLCVTEGRPAFMPWLLWCFDRQDWPRRELVIVDSSAEPFQIAARDDVRVVTAPPGTGIAKKRNLALEAAHGEIVTWFDDDDWQHPGKLTCLVKALGEMAPYAGSCRGWFVNLMRLQCSLYHHSGSQIVFNSAGFRRDAVLSLRFQENLRQASDTRWMLELAARYRGKEVILKREDMFFWLCHRKNLSNSAERRRFSQNLEVLRKMIGSEAWGDTDEALDALRVRLQVSGRAQRDSDEHSVELPAATTVSFQARNGSQHDESAIPNGGEPPPVGLMIKATVMDTPFLDVMVRHMIAQAHYAFAERTIVVDRKPAFTGKYQNRPRASREELDRILDGLVTDGVVDHVREVDMKPAVVEEIIGRYFENDALRVPTHAVTGGPIYATLFGLESSTTDHVLQMDADIFFYTGPGSWVGQAVSCMARDPRLWLMMTHPGPPAGPPGKSLGPLNARIATWDENLRIWRFRSATTRYFLCDRRKLHSRLHPILVAGGCAPLEQCLSAALQRHGAFRGALGNLESWHLHVWDHRDPFPLWASSMAEVIKTGYFPALQRGNYDLRLDQLRDRHEWGVLLERVVKEKPLAEDLSRRVRTAPISSRSQDLVLSRPAASDAGVGPNTTEGSDLAPVSVLRENSANLDDAGVAPVAVVIPVRNRAGQRLRNALRSLSWQSAGRPAQVIVVSHGSEPDINRELSEICDKGTATLITVGNSVQPWNKPLALNVGIRATPELPFVMTMDADMILAPNFLRVVLERLREEPPALMLCRSSDLPQEASLPSHAEELKDAFNRLRLLARLRPRFGTGGIQAARRSFFFDIRGYDEDLLWWGAMDGDLVNRARLAGMAIEWVEDRTVMLHQWHPHKLAVLTHRDEIEQARKAWISNHNLAQSRSTCLQRNSEGWGARGA